MWFIVALIFLFLAIKELVVGAVLAFAVYFLFAVFAIFLNKAGLDII